MHPYFDATIYVRKGFLYFQIIKQDVRIFPIGTFNLKLPELKLEVRSDTCPEINLDSNIFYIRGRSIKHNLKIIRNFATRETFLKEIINKLQKYSEHKAIELGLEPL